MFVVEAAGVLAGPADGLVGRAVEDVPRAAPAAGGGPPVIVGAPVTSDAVEDEEFVGAEFIELALREVPKGADGGEAALLVLAPGGGAGGLGRISRERRLVWLQVFIPL